MKIAPFFVAVFCILISTPTPRQFYFLPTLLISLNPSPPGKEEECQRKLTGWSHTPTPRKFSYSSIPPPANPPLPHPTPRQFPHSPNLFLISPNTKSILFNTISFSNLITLIPYSFKYLVLFSSYFKPSSV